MHFALLFLTTYQVGRVDGDPVVLGYWPVADCVAFGDRIARYENHAATLLPQAVVGQLIDGQRLVAHLIK